MLLSILRVLITIIFRYVLDEKHDLDDMEKIQFAGLAFNIWFGYFSAYVFLLYFLKDLKR
jgi:hypothetical protein